MAEQAGGGEAGALALGPRVLEEDGGAAGRGASERSADHARLERAQLRSAAAKRRRNGGGARIAGDRARPVLGAWGSRLRRQADLLRGSLGVAHATHPPERLEGHRGAPRGGPSVLPSGRGYGRARTRAEREGVGLRVDRQTSSSTPEARAGGKDDHSAPRWHS